MKDKAFIERGQISAMNEKEVVFMRKYIVGIFLVSFSLQSFSKAQYVSFASLRENSASEVISFVWEFMGKYQQSGCEVIDSSLIKSYTVVGVDYIDFCFEETFKYNSFMNELGSINKELNIDFIDYIQRFSNPRPEKCDCDKPSI